MKAAATLTPGERKAGRYAVAGIYADSVNEWPAGLPAGFPAENTALFTFSGTAGLEAIGTAYDKRTAETKRPEPSPGADARATKACNRKGGALLKPITDACRPQYNSLPTAIQKQKRP